MFLKNREKFLCRFSFFFLCSFKLHDFKPAAGLFLIELNFALLLNSENSEEKNKRLTRLLTSDATVLFKETFSHVFKAPQCCWFRTVDSSYSPRTSGDV